MIEAVAPAPTMYRPTAREVRALHERVKELNERLFNEKFGMDPEPWDHADDRALDCYLKISVSTHNPWSKVTEEIESLVTSYFWSDGISGAERPYQWLETLGKYRSGPLNKNGVPKSVAEAQEAEVQSTIEASRRKAEERKAADAASNREALFARLVMKVAEDLRFRGFECFKPIGATSYLVAVRKDVTTQNVVAKRIVCRKSADELTRNADFYQVVVDPDADLRVTRATYFPPLETE